MADIPQRVFITKNQAQGTHFYQQMDAFSQLNFPRYPFRIRKRETGPQIWDNIRRKWLVLTPEEWVRQHLIRFLTEARGVLPASISQEYPIELGGTRQRADLVVFARNGTPCLLAECKAPDVNLTQITLAQAVRYNSILKTPFVLLTNGIKHICYRYDNSGHWLTMNDIPDLSPFFRI